MTRWFDKLALAATVLVSPSYGADAPVAGGKVFTGPEGVRVEVVTLTPSSDKNVLIRIRGTDTELDDKALLVHLEEWGENIDYKTQLHGRDYFPINGRSRWGSREYTLNVPGRRESIHVAYDEKQTQTLKPQEVYALYQKQKSDGTLAKLQDFDRKKEEGKNNESFSKTLAAMNKACGSSTTATINWGTVPDELLKHLSISSYCGSALEAIEKLCDSNAGKKTIQAKVKRLECQFGSGLKMDAAKSGALTWTVSKDSSNLEDFATQYLEKNL